MTRRVPGYAFIVAAVVVGIALVAFSLGFYLYVRGGGPVPSWVPFRPAIQDPLAPSLPAEQVLRSMRLAGFERAIAGDEDGVALARIEVPGVGSPADVEIAWQAGASALAGAYPNADRYVVQVFGGSQALLELRWDGKSAREAVSQGDAAALKRAAEFVHLRGEASDG